MADDDWMAEQEQGVMADVKTYHGTSDTPKRITTTDGILIATNAVVSLVLGSIGAVRIVYGVWNPALTPGNALLFPAAFVLAMVMMLVWFLVFAAAIDTASNLIAKVTPGKLE